jgi:hypothetical protein
VVPVDDSSASIISGIPGHDIAKVELSNIHLYYKGGAAKHLDTIHVPEFEKRYPDPNKFGVIPAYGFFIRHVNNILLRDVTVEFLQPDHRPVFILDQVTCATFRNVKAQKTVDASYLILDQVKDLTLDKFDGLKDGFWKDLGHKVFQ